MTGGNQFLIYSTCSKGLLPFFFHGRLVDLSEDIRDYVYLILRISIYYIRLGGMEHITPEVKWNWNIIQF